MATHSSILAWRIPWTEEPGGLQSMGSLRVHGVAKSRTQLSDFHFTSLLYYVIVRAMHVIQFVLS